MNKKELIEQIAEQTKLTKKECAVVVNAMIDTMSRELQQDGEIRLTGFGTFEVKRRRARIGRNPRTNNVVEIPPLNVPVFRPGKVLKETINSK